MKGTPSFKTFPTVGSAESCIVRLPGTSTSCASAARNGAKVKRTAKNRSVPPEIFVKLILDSLPVIRRTLQFPEQRHSLPIARTAGDSRLTPKRRHWLSGIQGQRQE